MTEARDDILTAIRAARRDRPAAPPVARHILPARADADPATLAARFRAMADLAGASVASVPSRADLPAAVARFMAEAGLGAAAVAAPDAGFDALDWSGAGLAVRIGAPTKTDRVTMTAAVAGIAETGSLLVVAGGSVANAAHLVGEAHVVALPAARLVGGYEAAWRLMLAGAPELPRAATVITGPSRTADIEKTPQIGVHGPKRLLILLIDGETT